MTLSGCLTINVVLASIARLCEWPANGAIEASGGGALSAYSWPDTVEEVGSCQPLAGLIQSGPGDRSGSDDGGTPRPAGCAVLRVLARTACAGEAPAAID